MLLAAQPPAITQEGIRNLASQMPPSLPGGALSPGGLFSVRGLRLGGAATRILFRQGVDEREATVLALQPEYLEARVPLGLAGGDAQILVVRDGETSRPFRIRIARGAFGIFSENGKGWGPGGAEAHPGGPGVVRGTGLAGITEPEVWVGGVRALGVRAFPVADKPGAEEVRFMIAPSTPRGCYVPVLVKTEGGVSNAVTLPVSVADHPCSGSAPLGAAPDALLLLARLAMRVRLAGGAPADFAEDIGAALFPRDQANPVFLGWKLLPPTGTCTSYTGNWISDSGADGITAFLFASTGAGRDAGASIRVAGPTGEARLTPRRDAPGIYTAELGGGLPFTRNPKPRFLKEGTYRISGGGREIGAFAVEAPYLPPLEWLSPGKLDTVVRSQGATVRWRGARPDHRVLLIAFNVDDLSGGMGACLCVARGEAGRFRIPPLMLANVPASQNIPGIPKNFLLTGLLPAQPQRFSATGIVNGTAVAASLLGRTVSYR